MNALNKTGLIILMIISCVQEISAQKMHAFLFCNTDDPQIGSKVALNFRNMKRTTKQLSLALGYSYVPHYKTGSSYTINDIDEVIKNSDISNEDIVIMYISSHGAKSELDKNIFPQVLVDDTLISAYSAYLTLLAKKPHFIISVIEACSGYADIPAQKESMIHQQFKKAHITTLNPNEIRNIKSLFLKHSSIMISAGNPGNNTWATSAGSYFTNCFIRSIDEFCALPAEKNSIINWNNLLDQTRLYTLSLTIGTSIHYYPVWEKDGIIDSTLVNPLQITFNVKSKKTCRLYNPYNVDLNVINPNKSEYKIDSVVYHLDSTMINKDITDTSSMTNYAQHLKVYDDYPIIAEVFFHNGTKQEFYKNFDVVPQLYKPISED